MSDKIEKNNTSKPGAENWEKQRSLITKVTESDKTTVGEIAQDLGIKTKWLQDQTALGNTEVFSIKNKTGEGARHDKYDWGEPRVGDKFLVERSGGKYLLYRFRPSTDTITFIPIPDEGLGEKLKKYSSIVSAIIEVTQPSLAILSASIEENRV